MTHPPSSEAEIAGLRAERDRMRQALDRVECIVTELERQNKVNDSYARDLPKAERHTSELWLIGNSHIKDRTRELRKALSLADEEQEKA